MKYNELSEKHKRTAEQQAIDAVTELYRTNGIDVEISLDSPDVQGFLLESEYEIEKGYYEKGMPFERLVRLWI